MLRKKMACVLLVLAAPAGALHAQGVENATVEAATDVLHEIMQIPARAIPAALLADAQGVAIIPGMVKGGFIVGLQHGRGVMLSRNAAGEWIAPVFINVAGGSVGLQAGLQATDVVAVFRTRRGIDRLMRGKFTIGADAAVAAGPIGRDAQMATDALLNAEILSYSRSRGLFAGVSIDGAVMQIDHRSTAAYYAPVRGLPQGAVPAPAVKLVQELARFAGPKTVAINVREAPTLPVAPGNDLESIRGQLIESSLRLHQVLDPQWKEFLALPGDVYTEGKAPPQDAWAKCLERYNVVTNDPRYRDLSSRPEFRETHALLLRYGNATQGGKSNAMQLPPPPPR